MSSVDRSNEGATYCVAYRVESPIREVHSDAARASKRELTQTIRRVKAVFEGPCAYREDEDEDLSPSVDGGTKEVLSRACREQRAGDKL